MDEFDLIDRFFAGEGWYTADEVSVGPGDDCAVLDLPAGRLCVSTDTLVEGVHFPVGAPGEVVAHRVFVATVSDVAAMAARPVGLTLALTMPDADETFLQGYSDRLKALTQAYRTPLVGGNVARGPLSVTGQVIGLASSAGPLLRTGARVGDGVFVTGSPGAAALGLAAALEALDVDAAVQAPYLFPVARVAEALAAREVLHAGIDVTDGLLADLGHVCKASGVGARLEAGALPLSPGVTLQHALAGGDDYELCVTAAADARLDEAIWTRIGAIVPAADGVACVDASGTPIPGNSTGYRHF